MSYSVTINRPNESGGEIVAIPNQVQVHLSNVSLSASTAVSITNWANRGIIAWLECTSGIPPGSSSVTFALKVQAVAPVGTNRYLTLATSGAKSASGAYAVVIYPGISSTAVTNMAFNAGVVPRDLRLLVSISSGAASFGCVMSLASSFLK
jgi:hypothetical protein